MKLLRKYIEKDGSGTIGLRLEQDEDLWHGEVGRSRDLASFADPVVD